MNLSIVEAARQLRSGNLTSRKLTEDTLADIALVDEDLESFVLVDSTGALAAADRADTEIADGNAASLLTGIPVAVKDIIDMKGHPTRCGSRAYPDRPVGQDATIIEHLRAAGAVIVGKTTSHELACGVYTPPTSNPWAHDRLPGGSSGGSGAAVAAGLAPMALGSDTGGSIRIPAAVCGTIGLKPTYGRVSKAGVDWRGHLITLVRSPQRSKTWPSPSRFWRGSIQPTPRPLTSEYRSMLGAGVEGLRLGVLVGAPVEPTQPGVEDAFNAALDRLADEGAHLIRIEIPELSHTLAAEFGIVGPEAGAYHRHRLESRPDLIEPGIRALLVAGLLLPAVHYLKALDARRAITDALREAFSVHRLAALLTPTLPATAAFKDQEVFDYDGFHEPVTHSFVRTTAPFNLSGMPALSVPCGLDPNGLPVGLQIAGRPFDEMMVPRVGSAYGAISDWGQRKPEVHITRRAA